MVRRPRPDEDTEEREAFLRRWARRKAAANAEAVQTAEPDAQARQPASPPPSTEPAPPPKTDADMPPLESINENSDVSDFFSSGVSDHLRQTALRRLFHLPKFNVVDGLDDYADDFTSFAALGDIITADMRHRLEMEKERMLGGEENASTAPEPEQAQVAAQGEVPEVEEGPARQAVEDGAGGRDLTAAQTTDEEDGGRDDG